MGRGLAVRLYWMSPGRIRVSGWTIVRALLQSNHFDQKTSPTRTRGFRTPGLLVANEEKSKIRCGATIT